MGNVERIKGALPLGITVGLALAVLYLAGFWFPLRINPFQYATASDLTTATFASLGIVMIALAATMLVGGSAGLFLRESHDALDEKRSKENLKGLAAMVPPRSKVVTVLSWAAAVTLVAVILFATSPVKWYAMGGLLVVIATRPLSRFSQLGDPSVRPYLIFLILYVPFAFYGRGRVDSVRATNCATGVLIDATRSVLSIKLRGEATLLGTLGDYHFIYECSSRGVLILQSSNQEIALKADVNKPGQSVYQRLRVLWTTPPEAEQDRQLELKPNPSTETKVP